jgi:hypothetical protein
MPTANPSPPIKYPNATTYLFGSTSEVGIATESYEQNDQVDHYEQKNNVGEVIELVTFNPRGEITLSGQINASLTNVLGNIMTLSNLITTQYGTLTAGITVCKSVQYSKGRAKNMDVRITATYYPLLTP